MTDWLLSIDPGISACGCALWLRGGLRAAALVKSDVPSSEELGARISGMKSAVWQWSIRYKPGGYPGIHKLVELPQTYGGRAAKGDANDLIKVAAVAGALAWELVTPHEWKGNIPKMNDSGESIIEARCRAGALTPAEFARVDLPSARSLQHNVFDGIGIGLWYLKKNGLR